MPIQPVYEPKNPRKGNPPISARATLKKGNMDGGQAATVDPIGFVSGECPYHHQRGHLIANTLGGKNELSNLVTLTDGANHPAMYSMERIVKNIVTAHPGTEFEYLVIADYDNNLYHKCLNGVLGASGNPYCTPPDVPARLRIGFCEKGKTQSVLGDLKVLLPYDDAHYLNTKWQENQTIDGFFLVGNGMYKQHKEAKNHVPTCISIGTNLGVTQPECWNCKKKGSSIRFYVRASDWGRTRDYWHYCRGCNHLFCSKCAGTFTSAWFSWSRKCKYHDAEPKEYWTELFVVESD